MEAAEAIQELHQWLHTVAIDIGSKEIMAQAYGDKLNEVGVPVDRVYVGASVLHPQVAVTVCKWEKPDKVTEHSYDRTEYAAAKELIAAGRADASSPMMQLALGAPFVRIKVSDTDFPEDCVWMKEEGYTELFGLPSTAQSKQENGILEGGFTWTTKSADGFTEDHLSILRGHLLDLATVTRLHIKEYTCLTLLCTYLGQDAGRRVHRGEIERGDGMTIRSVIWFSDIRGFTQMSGEITRHEVLEVINGVFDVTHRVVRKYQGQVLKYMGDGVMVIFADNATSFQRESFTAGERQNLDETHGAKLCHNARRAALEFQQELATLKQEREAQQMRGASVGVGLHYGDVSYGNVGAMERLDFTVIGPAVNLASRVESQCSKLGAKVLASSDFVALDHAPQSWNSRGKHALKGVKEPVELFELASGSGQGVGQASFGASVSSMYAV